MNKLSTRFTALILVLITVVSMLPISVMAEETQTTETLNTALKLEISTATGTPGEEVNVIIEITDNPGITSFKFNVEYDEVLTLKNVEFSESFSGYKTAAEPYANPQTINFLNPTSTSNVEDTGVFATLTFLISEEADDNYNAEISISYDTDDVFDKDENNVEMVVSNGVVIVYHGVAGDIDGDGYTTMKDSMLLFRYISGWSVDVDTAALDVNGDNTINNKDAMTHFRYTAGWEGITLYRGEICTHDLINHDAVEATCTQNGAIEYWSCSLCNRLYKNDKGTEQISNGDIVVESVGHNEIIDPPVPATYETTGLTEGSHCSVCNEVIIPQKETPILQDTYYGITYSNLKGAESPELTQYGEHQGILPDEMPKLSVPGYIFKGWYTGTGENAQKIDYIAAGTTGTQVLFAQWELETYTITYRDVLDPIKTIEYNVEQSFEIYTPEWPGLTFSHWEDTSEKLIAYEDAIFVKHLKLEKGTTGDIEIVAKWRESENLIIPKKTDRITISGFNEAQQMYWFVYELGKIENVVLDSSSNIMQPYNHQGGNVERSVSESFTISESVANTIANTVAESVSKSESWSELNGWANKVSADLGISVKTGAEISAGVPGIGEAKGTIEKEINIGLGIEGTRENQTENSEVVELGSEEINEVSSTISYQKDYTLETTTVYKFDSTVPNGRYQAVHAGDVHVYAIAIYDPKTKTAYIETYSTLAAVYDMLIYERGGYTDYVNDTLSFYYEDSEIESVVKDSYRVEYDANGGEGVMDVSVHGVGKEMNLLPNSFIKTGYTFEYWEYRTEESIDTFTDCEAIKDIASGGETVTLYAHWTPIQYTVNYDGNGASAGSTASSSHTYDEESALTPNGFNRSFAVKFVYNNGQATTSTDVTYTFREWLANVGGTYEDQSTVMNLISVNGEVTMTAQWDGEGIILPTPNNKTGYTFGGWYADSNFATWVGSAGATYMPQKDITLYAKWNTNTYTVSYNVNGGKAVSPTSKSVKFDGKYGDLPTPTRDGYAFVGWYYNGNKITSSTLVTTAGNHTLKAEWTKTKTVVDVGVGRNVKLKRDEKTTDTVSSGLNRATLVSLGYTKLKITVVFDAQRTYSICLNKANLNVYLSNGSTAVGTKSWKVSDFPNNSWKDNITVEFSDLKLSALQSNGDIYLVWSTTQHANGSSGDGWHLGTTQVIFEATK